MATANRAPRVALTCAALVLLAGCEDDDRRPPPKLVNGASATITAVAFEDVDEPVVATTARVRPGARLPCGEGRGSMGRGVDRIGTIGSSITVLSAAHGTARACDATESGRWCGHAFARLQPGRQLDARLSATCVDRANAPVGFAWVRPSPSASYVVVAHPGYAEAYGVLGTTPVRVSTRDVDATRSTARFTVSEHDAAGVRLRAYVLQPRVAG